MDTAPHRSHKPKRRQLTGFECSICGEERGEDGFILHKTRRLTHGWCRECAEIGFRTQLETNSRRPTPDFNFTCGGSADHGQPRNRCGFIIDLRSLVIPADMVAIHQLLARITALRLPNTITCLHCDEIFSQKKDGLRVECPHCHKVWCRRCNRTPYHEGEICKTNDLMAAVRHDEGGEALVKLLQRDNCKPCPGCGEAIYKIGGCNEMTCKRCSVTWCWLCRTKHIDYDHFNSGGNCDGRLFNGAWE